MRVARVASMHFLQLPVPLSAPCVGSASWCAALCKPSVALGAVLQSFPVAVATCVFVAVLAEAPLFADRALGDMVMAPALLGLPLWGCLYSVLALLLPSVRCEGGVV